MRADLQIDGRAAPERLPNRTSATSVTRITQKATENGEINEALRRRTSVSVTGVHGGVDSFRTRSVLTPKLPNDFSDVPRYFLITSGIFNAFLINAGPRGSGLRGFGFGFVLGFWRLVVSCRGACRI